MTLEVGMSLPILVGARRGRPDADKGAQQARPDWAATDEVAHDATLTAFLCFLHGSVVELGIAPTLRSYGDGSAQAPP